MFVWSRWICQPLGLKFNLGYFCFALLETANAHGSAATPGCSLAVGMKGWALDLCSEPVFTAAATRETGPSSLQSTEIQAECKELIEFIIHSLSTKSGWEWGGEDDASSALKDCVIPRERAAPGHGWGKQGTNLHLIHKPSAIML